MSVPPAALAGTACANLGQSPNFVVQPRTLTQHPATQIYIMIVINNNSKTMFTVLSSWQSHCESSPGSFDKCRMAPSSRRRKTKPDDLGCESACIDCQSLHPPSPFIIITHHSARKLILILPAHGG